MNISTFSFIVLFISTFVTVGITTPIMKNLAVSKGILDKPNFGHKTHLKPIPYLGGVAIMIGVVFVTFTSVFLFGSTSMNYWLAFSILGPAFVLGIIGLWDDLKSLSPMFRFSVQSIAGVFVSSALVSTNNLGNPTGIIYFDILFTILWIVGICNSINFFDNLDGGAAGTCAISSISLFIFSIINGQIYIAALSVVLAGSMFGFLIWNRPPARIYMGDAGSLFLGVTLATLTIRLKPETDFALSSFSIPILILAVPILDTSVAVISRVQRKLSPFQGGQDHLSHRLIRYGFSRKLAVVILWLLSTVFCVIAGLIMLSNEQIEIIILAIAFVFWLLLFFKFISLPHS
jgi:UDP-GlcNAc:undecaprenyl-phosphate GlcNAc-1-phosphate transferase